MVDANSSESPLDAVASTVGERTIEAFEILGNETRLAILLALWEAQALEQPLPESSDEVLSFSELYDCVDIHDSGNFTYHLDRLVGPFLRETDEGYSLTTRAEQILQAVLAGTLTDPPSFEGEPIDAECYRCGAPAVIDYSGGLLTVRCTSCEGIWHSADSLTGTVISVYRPPVGLENRSPQEFFQAGNTWDRHRRFSLIEGACPACSGSVTTNFHVCESHDMAEDTVCEHCGSLFEIQTLFVCDICKLSWRTSAWGPIFSEMAVKAFYYEHGLDHDALFDTFSYEVIQDTIEQVEVTSKDPQELAVTVDLHGDRLEVVLDDEARVVDVSRTND